METITDLSRNEVSQIHERLIQPRGDTGAFTDLPGWLFKAQVLYFAPPTRSDSRRETLSHRLHLASHTARFAGATVVDDIEDKRITHVIVDGDNTARSGKTDLSAIRSRLAKRAGAGRKIPHIVTVGWIEESWKEKTLIDEESKS
jgi:DNA ligase-4